MAGSRFLLSIAGLLIALTSAAQQNRYMVFFKDKDGISESIDRPIEFLSEKAIQRRLEQNISITDLDLPVNKTYIEGVRAAGATTYYVSRWMNGILVACESSVATALTELPYVSKVEFVAPPGRALSGGRRSITQRKSSTPGGVETQSQLRMIGIDRMHQEGHRGEGVVIAVLDSGFPGVDQGTAFQHLFTTERLIAETSFDFVNNSSEVFQGDSHGTEVLSVMAAELPDAFTGGAVDASFILFVTEDPVTEYRVEEYNWLFAAERADSAGVDIIHSSLGYYDFDDSSMNYTTSQMDGKTAVITRAAQWAADRGIVVITSAGNEGSISSWRIITAPADAEGVLAIGAVNSSGQRSATSSIGPSADNRVKPDLAALGTSVRVIRPNGQIGSSSGTSLAAPLVTSLAAGVLQRYPDLSAREVLTLLRKTASKANKPDYMLGYGIPNFQAIINFQDGADLKEPFDAYPNPLRDRDTLTITPRDPNEFGSCDIEIVSSRGEVVARHRANFTWMNRNHQIAVAGMAPGIYYVRVLANRSTNTFKVVKLR